MDGPTGHSLARAAPRYVQGKHVLSQGDYYANLWAHTLLHRRAG